MSAQRVVTRGNRPLTTRDIERHLATCAAQLRQAQHDLDFDNARSALRVADGWLDLLSKMRGTYS